MLGDSKGQAGRVPGLGRYLMEERGLESSWDNLQGQAHPHLPVGLTESL